MRERPQRAAASAIAPCTGTGTGSAAEFLPERPTLATLRTAVTRCRGCGLWTCGHAVFGEGPRGARLMLVGEQPGDREEEAGHPFVGPSGRLLDAALDAAGIARDAVYVTNAVKHFKYERGEKSARRIHKKPKDAEVRACRPWLVAEIHLTKPRVIVALGATAAQALLGKQFRVSTQRGKPVPSEWAEVVMATVHPSAVLRAPPEERVRAEREFFADLRRVARYVT